MSSQPIDIPGAAAAAKRRRQRKNRCFECGHKMSPSIFGVYKCPACHMHFCALHLDYIHGHTCPGKDELLQKMKQELTTQLQSSSCIPSKIRKI